jgi:thymidine kinase
MRAMGAVQLVVDQVGRNQHDAADVSGSTPEGELVKRSKRATDAGPDVAVRTPAVDERVFRRAATARRATNASAISPSGE